MVPPVAIALVLTVVLAIFQEFSKQKAQVIQCQELFELESLPQNFTCSLPAISQI